MKRSTPHIPPLRSICLPCRQRLALNPFRHPPPLQQHFARPLTTTPQPTASSSSPPPLDYPLPAEQNQQNPQKRSKANLLPTSPPEPHKLHIYATKHNCHITLALPNRNALISVSAGNIGFRKAQRGTYDAAYQLGTFVLGRIQQMGLLSESYPGKGGPLRELEVVWRDFGPGREAVGKILLGGEGRGVRERVVAVRDGTRLKFGGTRSKKPRRLG
ncbi:hypothetical protein ACLMJK_003888 [Lecanora helva]